MLKQIKQSPEVAKEQYKPLYKQLCAELAALQQQARAQGAPIVVVFEGWSAAGKGSRIGDLILNLDPRGFSVHSTRAPVGNDARLPFLARFWAKLCAHGEMSIFDRAWYSSAMADAQASPKPKTTLISRMSDIAAFERQLCDDGYTIVKFFLHISQKEQLKRLKNLKSHPNTAWRVCKRDFENNAHYDRRLDDMDTVLDMSNYDYAPWTVLNVKDERYANIKIAQTLITAMKSAIKHKKVQKDVPAVVEPDASTLVSRFTLVKTPSLGDVRHDLSIADKEYDEQLKQLQSRLKELHNRLYREKIPMIIAYEGHDAAGKGGNIKRLAAALDARGYEVHPVCAPSSMEKAHPYLWRFWNKLPLDGHIAIYDRTWYGRVLVERVEGFAPPAEWLKAYDQINEFEYQLNKWGAIIQKFWVDVSYQEQLNRFEARQNTPQKQWKITDEDWRNREKFPQYVLAVNDMLRLTSTDFAPWTIIESDDKHYARIKALKSAIAAIERKL